MFRIGRSIWEIMIRFMDFMAEHNAVPLPLCVEKCGWYWYCWRTHLFILRSTVASNILASWKSTHDWWAGFVHYPFVDCLFMFILLVQGQLTITYPHVPYTHTLTRPNGLCFGRSNPQNKAFSNRNKGHLRSRLRGKNLLYFVLWCTTVLFVNSFYFEHEILVQIRWTNCQSIIASRFTLNMYQKIIN